MRKLIGFLHVIGTIMYVGGIPSHIVITVLFFHSSPETTITVFIYKVQSACLLILPGLALKTVTDLILWFVYRERAWWMRIKLACTAFLTMNAFVFLVPMMPELLALAEASVPEGVLSEVFLALEGTEQLVGMSNVIPLVVEMVMGTFRHRIIRAERLTAENNFALSTKVRSDGVQRGDHVLSPSRI